jgi:hypothetical protein
MSVSEILQKKIDEHLKQYDLAADHDTHQLFDQYGSHKGLYEIEEGDSNPYDSSVTINFTIDSENGITILPTLTVRF